MLGDDTGAQEVYQGMIAHSECPAKYIDLIRYL